MEVFMSTFKHDQVQSKSIGLEPSTEEKAAFVKAVLNGIVPGTEAADAVERKRIGPAGPDVEIVRRIPAGNARDIETPNAASAAALDLAAIIDDALGRDHIEVLDPHAQQVLIGALCRLYGANDAANNCYEVLSPQSAVSATDAIVLCSALLKAVDLQVFELALWQSWSGRR